MLHFRKAKNSSFYRVFVNIRDAALYVALSEGRKIVKKWGVVNILSVNICDLVYAFLL